MMKIHENGFGSSWYDEQTLILHETYTGLINVKLAIDATTKNLEFCQNNTIKGDLIDLSQMKGTFTAINDYLEKEYFPFFIGKGCVAIAIVYSDDVFTQFAVDDILRRTGSAEMKVFDDMENATHWIEEKIQNSKMENS